MSTQHRTRPLTGGRHPLAHRDHPDPVAGAAGHHPGLGPGRLRRQPLRPGPRTGHDRAAAEQRHLQAGPATIGLYGGLTVALFLVGWATGGILFGILADYFGRTRVLSIGILTYAVFTALAAFADTWWQLGILRFIAGLGSGVEAPVGAALIAEVWRNRYRASACGVMMSGYAAGFFIAAAAYALLGDHGWRLMLALAVLPALLVWFIRRYVPEPPEITGITAPAASGNDRAPGSLRTGSSCAGCSKPPLRGRR